MENKKIAGWLIVVAGLFLIGVTISSTYAYFTGTSEFPSVFKTGTVLESSNGTPSSTQDPQAQVQQAVNQAVGNILPAGSVDKTLNMVSWSVFATFLVYAGAKIAEIGIKLLA
ncbi:MAG: hypothetical protein MUD10_03040 [Candidatus Pacebacteria bacterium]|jgi:predicted ribosomally synthesized peptide with SipW-like signal peptide|nr:hypothetical protein [Candidatus Paceibacterota bacterium]